MQKLKAGQEFVGVHSEQKSAVIRATEKLGNVTYVTYLRIFTGSYSSSQAIATSEADTFLCEYKEKEDFFVVGGQYRSGKLNYYVQELYTISNPITPNYRKQARAIIINADGKRWMEMLSAIDFRCSERVK